MKRHLFLTGPIGCGKSTILQHALGPERLQQAGGFLTVRRRREDGRPARFVLMDPAGKEAQTFLDLTGTEPRLDMEAFSLLGVSLLHGAAAHPFVILDEIGGVELLCPEFVTALYTLLKTDIPIIGVLKGDTASSAMIRRLGLSEEYEAAANALHRHLSEDGYTLLYTCGQYDSRAPELAREWVKEYIHD